MYEVYENTQLCMMKTDSFVMAVCYAKENGWSVYSTELKRLVYDGVSDMLFL